MRGRACSLAEDGARQQAAEAGGDVCVCVCVCVLSAALWDVVVFRSHAHVQAEIGDQQWQNLRSLCVRMEHVLRVPRGKGLEDEMWRAD